MSGGTLTRPNRAQIPAATGCRGSNEMRDGLVLETKMRTLLEICSELHPHPRQTEWSQNRHILLFQFQRWTFGDFFLSVKPRFLKTQVTINKPCLGQVSFNDLLLSYLRQSRNLSTLHVSRCEKYLCCIWPCAGDTMELEEGRCLDYVCSELY